MLVCVMFGILKYIISFQGPVKACKYLNPVLQIYNFEKIHFKSKFIRSIFEKIIKKLKTYEESEYFRQTELGRSSSFTLNLYPSIYLRQTGFDKILAVTADTKFRFLNLLF